MLVTHESVVNIFFKGDTEKVKTVLNFNNKREIVELRITVPGHPEKRVKLISYQDLDGHVPGFVPRNGTENQVKGHNET